MSKHSQISWHQSLTPTEPGRRRKFLLRAGAIVLAPVVALMAGCGAGPVIARSASPTFSITPDTSEIDTNCTGCNAIGTHGSPVDQFSARLANGDVAAVEWSVSGGDPSAGPGTITETGQYTPPTYLTSDKAAVVVTAALKSNSGIRAESLLTLTPGFLQPLTPENLALGPNGSVTITGLLAEAGGANGIHFGLSNTPTGDSGGEGTLNVANCQRTRQAFTTCSVTYTAPAQITSTGITYVVATVAGTSSRTEAAILLNSSGVTSNPATHQDALPAPMLLGSSGGNNNDFDERGNTIFDCCSGTLGALVKDESGREYLLSNNHVLARSDHASVGDSIVQPGLIDNNCTPNGDGPGTVPVAALSAWLPLRSAQTNADAAIAQVASHTVDTSGSILELGTRQSDGSLSAAPPGISSTNGKGENATLQLHVAKSGRTTGLTCGKVTALDLDVSVDYYRDCAETRPYLTKTFTGQIAVSGDRFSDAGDSGALIVDAANAEPVGLFFAGGIDVSGVSHGIASPAPDVLNGLAAQMPGDDTSLSFVGGADHGVSCLSYGDSTVSAAQALSLSDAEITRQQQALAAGRALVNPAAGILGIAPGKSTDQPGAAALIVYVDQAMTTSVPASVEGVRTMVIPATMRSVALGSAPAVAPGGVGPLPPVAIAQAITVKQQVAHRLMQQNAAFFGIGVGRSLDNPREAALVIYVDRDRMPAQLPSTIGDLRTRYVVMNRLHVTRSYANAFPAVHHCKPNKAAGTVDEDGLFKSHSLDLP